MSGPLHILRLRQFFAWGLLVYASALFSGFAANTPDISTAQFFSRSWHTDDGLPDNAVTAAVQTRDGYLWVGTYSGLARFDGARFVLFNSALDPGLQSDRITCLSADPDGDLWIGHERGDLTCYRNGNFEPQDVREAGVRRKISAIGTDESGDVWMLNEEGTLLRKRDSAMCALPNNDGVAEMARDQKGTLWIASGGRLGRLVHGQLQTNDTSFGSPIQGLCASRDGGVWVIGDGLVRKWNGNAMVEDRGPNPDNITVISMLEMSSGALAMGTSGDGLYLLFPNRTVLHFNQANGFPNNRIRFLCEDHEGTLWMGAGTTGLTGLRREKIETLQSPDNWQNNVPLSVTASRDGAIWVGTEGAGLYRFSNGDWRHFSSGAGFSNLYVWCASEDSDGHMWAGTWGGGIYWQEGDNFVPPPGLENMNYPAAAILQGAGGVTWIGTANGLLRYDHGSVTRFGDDFKVPDVRAIVQDRDGTIWFGMVGSGVGRLKNGQLTHFQKSDGLSSDYIQCLHLDPNGALWIGSDGSGLVRFKDNHFAMITMAEGLPNNTICAMEGDGRGNFWISSHNGLFRVSEADLNRCADGQTSIVAGLAYNLGDGMPSRICSGGLQPASCKLADGRLCFSTTKGIVIVNPNDLKVNRTPPPVVIESVIAGGHSFGENLTGTPSLKIPPGQQRFEFHYTGLSFVAPEKMRFQYRLEGWEKDWENTASSSRRVAEYSYIPPGRYTFQVRACNSDGVWNENGASVALMVLPHFWQTWWFDVLTGVAMVAAVASIVWYVSRRRMRHKLEAAHRLQAIERERTRIAKDIHDHLGANLTRISLLSQSAHGELQNPVQAAVQLDRIFETTRDLTRALDEIVWAVNPQHDTLDSLASYLGNFAQDYLGSLGRRCRLDVPLRLPHWPITAETRHNIFLAFKEVLNNVVKHSGATEVSVVLATQDDGFQVTVKDNGKGFDPSAVPIRPGRGNGLKNMQQRLEKIGGHCEIHSQPGAGTEIRFFVSVPLAARAEWQASQLVIN